MMLKEQAKRSQQMTQRLVERFEDKVKRFRSFSLPELGIHGENPMEILEDVQGEIDPLLATKTAVLMENFVKETMARAGRLDETSRAALPHWVKNGLALIAAAQSDDITDKVIVDQTLPSRSGRIHFLDVVTERAKGNIPDRARMFDALAGFRGTQDFTSHNIKQEPVGVAGGTDYAPTVGYGPVIPGTFVMTDGTQIIRDDRNGNLVGDVGASGGGITNTIDYLTRQVSARFAGATAAAVRVDYQYNIEAALVLPEYGIQIRAKEVTAQPRALGATWSQQSLIDFMNDFGIDAEPTIIEAGARLIAQETFKHVVNTLRANAAGGSLVFDNTAPAGVSYRDHLKTFGIYISRLQDLVWEATQLVRPNVMVIHPSIMFAVAYQDGFQGQKFANNGIQGPRFVGRLTNHDLDVFVDPTYTRDQALLTHRGAEFVSTAAVKGTYVPLYKAPIHTRAFRKDFALLTEYTIEVIDPQQIATLAVTNL
jgi:hypothetical protein